MQVVPEGLSKWGLRGMNRVYFRHSSLHAGSVDLLFNTRTGNILPQYHVVFDNTFSTMEHMSKGTVPGNWKNLIEEHSDITT